MEKLMCSVVEAAASLSVSRATIYNWMNEGRINAVRVGGRRLVEVASLKKLVDQ